MGSFCGNKIVWWGTVVLIIIINIILVPGMVVNKLPLGGRGSKLEQQLQKDEF